MHTQIPSILIDVPELVSELERTADHRRLEIAADLLGAARERRAASALLGRLGDPVVQTNRATEDAACAALVALGVMRRSASGGYMLLPRHLLDHDVAQAVADVAPTLPLRYFFVRR